MSRQLQKYNTSEYLIHEDIFVKMKPISVNTIMRYLWKLYLHVQQALIKKLPRKFGLIFDGWTAKNYGFHLVAIFANCPVRSGGAANYLLSCRELEDPTNETANNHCGSIKSLLEEYNNSIDRMGLFILTDCIFTLFPRYLKPLWRGMGSNGVKFLIERGDPHCRTLLCSDPHCRTDSAVLLELHNNTTENCLIADSSIQNITH